MSDDARASVLDNALSASIPGHLNQNDPTQKLIYALNWNDKPEVVSHEKLILMAKDKEFALYRTVNGVEGTNITSGDIAKSIRESDVFQTSGKNSTAGDRVHGGGMYMANGLKYSQHYGDDDKAYTMAAVLNDKAKTVSYSDLDGHLISEWAKKNPKSAKAIGITLTSRGNVKYSDDKRRFGTERDQRSMAAISMGYNTIQTKVSNYYTIFDRGVLTMSNKNVYHDTKGIKGEE